SVERFFVAGDRSAFPDTEPFDALTGRSADGVVFPRVGEHALASILYTSGTTARPKGVTHSHATLIETAVNCFPALGLQQEPIFGCFAPLCHMSGFGFQMLPALRQGATLLVIPRFEPDAVLHALQEHQANVIVGLPMMYSALLHSPAASTCDLSALEI